MRLPLGATLIVILITLAGYAQTFRGAINGNVTDPSGAVVAGATVQATNNATGVVRSTVTTSDGQFAFQDLPLGSYKIIVTASGFKQTNVDNVTVTAGGVYTLPVKLSVGQQATTIEVSAAAVALDTTTQTQNLTIPNAIVQNLPLNGRDFTQLISVAPGYGGYSVGGFGSLNGTRANQMNWQIDGVDNNDFWHNIPAVNQGGVSGIAGIIMPIDATDEFSAQTQSGAEAGRNAGGTVNLVLKSGTNGLHGSAYYFNRNEFYGAASPFKPAAAKTPELRNQNYGFSVGGPIVKDRAFFFASFEKQQYIIGLSGLATEPSAAWVANAGAVLASNGTSVSQTSCNLLGPLTRLLPSGASCTPTTSAGLWPTSGPGSIADLPATVSNFFSPVASTGYSYNGVAKIDYNFSQRHHLSVRWFGGQGSQTAPLGSSPALGTASSNLAYYFEKAPIHVYNYAVVLNSALSVRMTNQLLFGVNYFNQTFSDANNSFDTKAMGLFLSPDATIKGHPILGAPNIAICPSVSGICTGGFEQIGLTPPEGRNDVTGMLSDIVSYNVGKHQLRFGGEVRQGRVNEFYHRRGTGKFSFDGTQGPWAGSCAATDQVCLNTIALADFLAGDVSTSSIAVGNPERFVRVNGFNLFAQDAIQISRKLNLNFGLRYEYFGPLYSPNKDLAVFIPGRGMLIQGHGIGSIFPPDRNNFAPRFGFAYQPRENGNLVVRGGVGVFYDQINMNPFLDFRPPISGADGLQDNPIGPAAVSNYSLNGYNWDLQQAVNTSVFPGVTLCPSLNIAIDPSCGTNTFNVYSVNQNFRAPYFFNYNLQVEKSMGTAAVFQIGYVGSEGRKLSTMLNINQVGANTTGRFNLRYPNVGTILQLNSATTSNYNSLQTSLRIRSWHGLSSQFGYTWAHALDDMSEYRAAIPLDSYNLKADYGNGDFDTRHNFTASFTYNVPGASWGPKIITHGWQVNSLWSFHTGQPFNITGGFSRPGCDLVGDPFLGLSHEFSQTAGGVKWVNPSAFNCSSPTTFLGNLSRNKFYAPGYGDVDLSVFKNIPITERFKVQLRAEMFNLFNRINLASGAGSVGSNGFVSDTIGDFNGAPGIGPGEAFNMQLAAKIIF
jgi:Carboxypeptidase regulatory-like domain/TonB dependent receptor